MKTTGITLIVVGLLLTIFTSFSFFSKKEVANVGKLEINREKRHDVNWPPYLGIGIMVAGGVVLLASAKRKVI